MGPRCLTLVLVVCWVSWVCHGQTGNEEMQSPIAQQPLKRSCRSKEDCPDHNFCEGRGPVKRCRECIDCQEFQRQRKKSYDGESCATHFRECGECNEGYEERGGFCIPKATSPLPVAPHIEPRNDEKDSTEEATFSPISLFLAIVIMSTFVIVFMVGTVKYFYNKKDYNRSRNEEEAGLTSCNGINGPYEQPTAPPPEEEEYRSRPAYNPLYPKNTFVTSYGGQLPKRAHEIKSRAIPFDAGNGAGPWAYGQNEAAVAVPDTVDGAGASIPAEPQQPNETARANPSVSNHVGNGNDQGEERRGNSSIPPQASGRPDVSDTSSRGRQTQAIANAQPPIELPLSHTEGNNQSNNPALPPQQENDSILGTIAFSFHLQALFSRMQAHSNPAGSQTARFIASAPTSPRRIDDTHVVSLNELPDSFLSNASLDSGTGTSEHDRSVPSRSVSGGFSDLDESGHFEEEDTLYPRSAPQRVPDVDEHDEPMDYE